MNLIYEMTEVHLNTFIEQIRNKPQSWRVISIEFQNCETLHSNLFQNLCHKNLHQYFDQSECKIFWIKPGFVLVFFQGRAMPIEKCVEGFLKETEFKGFGRFFDILDLSIHWSNLISLVGRITAPLNKSEVKVAPVISSPVSSDGFNIELSEERINQLKATRQCRTSPLILLVEDDPFTLQLVKLAFKDEFEIITAETARQALVYYQRHLPNMVFLDIQLPDGDGKKLLRQMTKADSEAHIVMLSSHSQKEIILDCIQNGAKGFIAKPFTRQRLVETTDRYKQSHKSLLQGSNKHGT